jgi:hypothetical protein
VFWIVRQERKANRPVGKDKPLPIFFDIEIWAPDGKLATLDTGDNCFLAD